MTKPTYIKIIGIVIATTFSVTLALLIGNRLSSEAMAVLAGAVCGVAAAIPTSLLITAIALRTRQTETTQAPRPQFTQPVMMIPPVQIATPPAPPPATWGDAPLKRTFHVVGQMGEEE